MLDRRVEIRMLCADLVDLRWKDKGGKTRRLVANLEDISLSGACIQVDKPIPLGTNVSITHSKGELQGIVRYCVFREIGYYLGIEFEPDSHWSQRQYQPQHMLDPRRVVRSPVHRDARRDPNPRVN